MYQIPHKYTLFYHFIPIAHKGKNRRFERGYMSNDVFINSVVKPSEMDDLPFFRGLSSCLNNYGVYMVIP